MLHPPGFPVSWFLAYLAKRQWWEIEEQEEGETRIYLPCPSQQCFHQWLYLFTFHRRGHWAQSMETLSLPFVFSD